MPASQNKLETLQSLRVLLSRLASQHLFGMSANRPNYQIKLSGSLIQIVVMTVMSHGGQECGAGFTFDDAQDICHTAGPAFSMLRTIHLLIEAVNHNLQGRTQQLEWLFMRDAGQTECCSGICCKCLGA